MRNGLHILPDAGDLPNAHEILARVGLNASGEMSIKPIAAGPILDFLIGTGRTIAPRELDAALLASDAYVGEYHRSNGKSTDAPWDWPKIERDLEILGDQAEDVMRAIMR